MPREEACRHWEAAVSGAVSLLAALLLVLVLGLTAPPPTLAGTWAHPVPVESIPDATRDRMRSIVQNAVPAFALHTDWRPLDAGSDTQGRSVLFLDRGPLSDALAAVGSDGTVLWEHEIAGCNASSVGPLMRLGGSGSVLATLGVSDEGDAHYLLLRPDGSVALDDTLPSLGEGRVLTLSPCGKYYYRFRHALDEIQLQLEGQEDLPQEQHRSPQLAGDHTPEGDLILFEKWAGEYDLKYEVCCYAPRGARKWHQYPNLRPSWIVAAQDRPTVAVGNTNWLTTLDTRTGAVLDTQRLWAEETQASPWGPYEIAFEDGLLVLWARGGGDGMTPILISAGVGEDGKIAVPVVTRDWIWGLGKNRPICGATVEDPAGGWLIVGFRR